MRLRLSPEGLLLTEYWSPWPESHTNRRNHLAKQKSTSQQKQTAMGIYERLLNPLLLCGEGNDGSLCSMKCLRGRICFVLSVMCAVSAVIICIYSLWLIETPRKGMGGILSEIYGGGGLLVASIFALCGVVLSIISIRRIGKTSGSFARLGWSIGVLVICSLLFLIALVRYLKHEF